MEMQKLLIADTSEEFCTALAGILGDTFDIRLCSEGNRALELMKSFRPDVVFLDMALPGMDGIAILENAISNGISPVVLAAISHLSDYICFSLNRLGVGYVVRRPYTPKAIAERMADMNTQCSKIHLSAALSEDPIKTVLSELCIREKRAGYTCLYAAIEIAQNNPGQFISKVVYPAVAVRCGGTSQRVEKAIRDVIRQAWNNRNERVWQRYFPAYCNRNEYPKNREFIAGVISYLSAGERFVELSGSGIQRGA